MLRKETSFLKFPMMSTYLPRLWTNPLVLLFNRNIFNNTSVCCHVFLAMLQRKVCHLALLGVGGGGGGVKGRRRSTEKEQLTRSEKVTCQSSSSSSFPASSSSALNLTSSDQMARNLSARLRTRCLGPVLRKQGDFSWKSVSSVCWRAKLINT